jgi:hypothetical protein
MLFAAFAQPSIEEYAATPHRGLACLYITEFLVLLIRSVARHISLEYTGDMNWKALLWLVIDCLHLSLDFSILAPCLIGVVHFMAVRIYRDSLRRTGQISISANLTLWATFLLSGGYVLGGAPIYAGQNDAFTTCHRIGIPIFLTAFALVCSVHVNRYTALRIMRNHYKGLWPPSGLFAQEAMKKLEQYVTEHIEPCIETDEHLNPPWQCWTEAERSRYPGTNPTACEDVSPFGSSPRRSSFGHTAIMQPPAKIMFEQFEAVTSLGTKWILIIIENEV